MKKHNHRASPATVMHDFPRLGFWQRLRDFLSVSPRPLDCLQIEITTQCNNLCSYCPHTFFNDRWRAADMRWETFARLSPLMRRSGRVHLQGWGEPLLHPEFFRMVRSARQAGCAVSTTTSGMVMSESLALQLVQSGMDIIAFSLAGTDAVSNGAREGAPFERVCHAIEYLQSVRRACQTGHPKIHIAYLLLASGMAAASRLPALMQRLGVDAAVISTLDYGPAPGLETETFGIHEREKLARAAALLSVAADEARGMGMQLHWALPDPGAPGNQCRENITRSLFVAVDGSVSPCVFTNLPVLGQDHMRRVFGNVDRQDPLSIWRAEPLRRFRQSLACGHPDPICQNCPKRFEVGGGPNTE